MASLPKFDLPVYVDNPTGWGPSLGNNGGTLDQFKGMPFQLFNKCDRVGRIIDWLGVDRYYKKSETRDRYNERIYGSSATAGGQYDYVHDNEDANFQLVDSSKPVRPQRTFRRPYGQFRNLAKKDQERREAKNPKTSQKMNRAIAKEQMRQYKLWQRRGGGARNVGGRGPQRGRFGDRQGGKARQPSVQVRQEWKVLQELDFPQLGRLSLPNVETAEDVPDESYGTLYFYDKSIDKVSVKNPIPLKRCGGTFYNITTTDDPVIQRLAQSGVGNVFATDMILATLMTTTRSVNSWDIVAHKLGNKIFFDKRDTGDITNPV
ncbi:CBN-EIF-3.D protein, partial [Aphelenchoides avenae]